MGIHRISDVKLIFLIIQKKFQFPKEGHSMDNKIHNNIIQYREETDTALFFLI